MISSRVQPFQYIGTLMHRNWRPGLVVLLFLFALARSAGAETGVVDEVVDGDTLRVRTAGSDEAVTVRLIGIDTPERSHPSLGNPAPTGYHR